MTVSKQEQNTQKLDSIFAFNDHYTYTLRKDDKINVSVWDNDDLSVGSIYGIYNSNEVYGKWLMLDDSGYVSIPKLGKINLFGLSVNAAKEKLTLAFKKWIVNPIVDVKVLNKEVTVLGELKAPGKILLEKENNTLLELIGKAGDFDFYANKKKIQVIRIVNSQPVSFIADLSRLKDLAATNIQIHPGDIIYVPSRRGKEWDRRAGSTIVPIASAISTAVLLTKIF
ncbi:polysaccharide biosynthesis/export family protein [Chitinophaga sancti]|nr:polysaccharide biosynthesis/export family protein [Chitinophaga sancti]WQD62351.1 polysaccharide biosynthesis/export family protein [Chitinophaga sancti]WQG92080.1 polysaccharide biosynthesis/export family protein [Chitinophaga sancti]